MLNTAEDEALEKILPADDDVRLEIGIPLQKEGSDDGRRDTEAGMV